MTDRAKLHEELPGSAEAWELHNCWKKSESKDQELEMDRCHGVNTGAGQVSKGRSPVAQLSWIVQGEHHQEQDLKQRLYLSEKGPTEGQIALTV